MTTKTKSIPFGRPILGAEEKNRVLEVLESPLLVHGPQAEAFEASFKAFTKSPYAVSLSSCTAGLHLAYFYLGIKPGDEVIVPAQTHVATVHAVEFMGGTPVFVDAERETGNINIEQIEAKITDKTKAISVVHFLGMPVAMDRVIEIAKKHNLFVVEDCALAVGSFYKGVHVGLHGDLGCYSFYPIKHMTTAEGGMMITRQEEIAAKIKRQKAFGVDRHQGERTVPGVYDVNMLGFNYRMNEIQAAIGIEQTKRLPGFLKKREANYQTLSTSLRDIAEITQFKSTHGDYKSSYYCLSIILSDELTSKRFEIVKYLKEHGVGTSVYYPKPIPHLEYYSQKYGYDTESSFPNASWISYQSIALPVGPHLDQDDMREIAQQLKNAISEVKKIS